VLVSPSIEHPIPHYRTVEYQELKGAAAMARLLTESRSD